MTAFFLGLAAVLVALLARDVALRVLAEKARTADAERATNAELAEMRISIASLSSDVSQALAGIDARLAKVEERAERLDAKDRLQQMARR